MTGDLEELRAALATLGAEQREVIALHYDGGLTLVEVAEVLGCPRGTVDSRLHRALSRLRERVSPSTAALVPTPAFASLLQRTQPPTSPAPTLTALRALRPSAPPLAPGRGASSASALALAALAASLLGALAFGVLTDGGGPGGATSVATPAPVSAVTSRPDVASAPVTTSTPAGGDPPSVGAIEQEDAPELPPPDDPAPELVQRPLPPAGSRTAALELLFVDTDGRPAPLVRVEVRQDRHEAFGVGGGVSRRAPTTDAAGRVVFEGLGPGDYVVEWDAPDGLSDGRRSLQKPRGEPRLELTIPLEHERWVEGRVVDVGGAPFPGASVRAFNRRTETDAAGRFRLGPLGAGGHVTVTATTTDRREARLVVDLAAAGEVALRIDPSVTVVGRVDEVPPDPRVARVEGAEAHVVEVILGDDGEFSCSLKPGSYRLVVVSFAEPPTFVVRTFVVPDGAARVDVGTLRADGPLVRARVVDERGAPLEGAVLVTLLDDAAQRSEPSGADGRVEVRLPPTAGRLQVRLGHPDHLTAERTLLAEPLLDLGDVALARAARLRLTLHARGGAGFRSNGGRPAVWASSRDGAVRLVTTFELPEADDPFGLAGPEYVLPVETKLAPGLHRLWVIQGGYAPVDLGEVEVRDGAPPRDVDLAAGGVLVVRTLGPGGEPLEGAELSLDDSPDPSRVERTDALGRATFEHVAPGTRHVRSPWLDQPAEVDVRLGEQATVELRLRRP